MEYLLHEMSSTVSMSPAPEVCSGVVTDDMGRPSKHTRCQSESCMTSAGVLSTGESLGRSTGNEREVQVAVESAGRLGAGILMIDTGVV